MLMLWVTVKDKGFITISFIIVPSAFSFPFAMPPPLLMLSPCFMATPLLITPTTLLVITIIIPVLLVPQAPTTPVATMWIMIADVELYARGQHNVGTIGLCRFHR
ncbi:hypothetical protein ACFFW8_12585 [Erwinia tracheiphila]